MYGVWSDRLHLVASLLAEQQPMCRCRKLACLLFSGRDRFLPQGVVHRWQDGGKCAMFLGALLPVLTQMSFCRTEVSICCLSSSRSVMASSAANEWKGSACGLSLTSHGYGDIPPLGVWHL